VKRIQSSDSDAQNCYFLIKVLHWYTSVLYGNVIYLNILSGIIKMVIRFTVSGKLNASLRVALRKFNLIQLY